jgi:MOSC domain-containing protein YiiM
MAGIVIAVAQADTHRFSKRVVPQIRVVAGLGVAGDAHAGRRVRHRSRVRADPSRANLRQVHLIQAELFDALARRGYEVRPGDLGENVATRGLDLLGLPEGTLLRLGAEAVLRVTGLRNPCAQIEAFRAGLLREVLGRNAEGALVRRCGIMTVAVAGGIVAEGDPVAAELPSPPHRPLDVV